MMTYHFFAALRCRPSVGKYIGMLRRVFLSVSSVFNRQSTNGEFAVTSEQPALVSVETMRIH